LALVTRVTHDDVIKFAQAISKERRSNFGTRLAWNFGPDAKRAAAFFLDTRHRSEII
jgi:hypothetical protein